jgi:glutathione synthase
VKKNSSYGGKGVSRIWNNASVWLLEHSNGEKRSFSTPELLLETLFSEDSDPYEFVRFLKNVTHGDKRVIVVDGKILGGYLRCSSTGGWIQNITAGGTAHAAEVSEHEENVVAATWPEYACRGVRTLGYDFLLDDDGLTWILSEINAGNIGGYGRLEQLSGKPIYDQLFECLSNVHKAGSASL